MLVTLLALLLCVCVNAKLCRLQHVAFEKVATIELVQYMDTSDMGRLLCECNDYDYDYIALS